MAGTYTDSLVFNYKDKTIETVTVSYTVTEDGVKLTPMPKAAPTSVPEYDVPDTAVKN